MKYLLTAIAMAAALAIAAPVWAMAPQAPQPIKFADQHFTTAMNQAKGDIGVGGITEPSLSKSRVILARGHYGYGGRDNVRTRTGQAGSAT